MQKLLAKYCCIYTEWNGENVLKWRAQQTNGIIKFVLVEGVFKWGLISITIFLGLYLNSSAHELTRAWLIGFIWLSLSTFYGICVWFGTKSSFELNHSCKGK
jgi:hypothetical protein